VVRVLSPWGPTPHDVVDRMIRLAAVTSADTVYDLGCGDGRLVIAAAARCGAKAVGVDIDPRRIKESRANAKLAGVSKLVRFEQRDAFDVDLAPATVIFLYLRDWATHLVAAHLLRHVTPGTRLVSHQFPIEFLTPEAVDTFVAEDGEPRTLRRWVIEG
jgi:SAM-dependent methyltransferase